uniref:Sirtuin 3 n=1 Tax=Nomascus leucogenys TaxID=61853 RepID=A0A2I3HJ34_NOMLE
MAFWGWRAAAAVRLWGRVVERAEAGGGVGTFQACGCRLLLGGRDDADVMADRVPRCPVCTGVVKPDIVFFGEPLPQKFLLHVVDFPMADLLLILGTSLEVCQQACAGRRLEGRGREGYRSHLMGPSRAGATFGR